MNTLLEQAQTRFRECEQPERDNSEEAVKDPRFVAGGRWNERHHRDMASQPALTIHELPTFVQQVVHDGRQNKPAIKTGPVDNGADQDTAEIMQGVVRHRESDSDAGVAYPTAFEYSVPSGFGAFRILADYTDERAPRPLRRSPMVDC